MCFNPNEIEVKMLICLCTLSFSESGKRCIFRQQESIHTKATNSLATKRSNASNRDVIHSLLVEAAQAINCRLSRQACNTNLSSGLKNV